MWLSGILYMERSPRSKHAPHQAGWSVLASFSTALALSGIITGLGGCGTGAPAHAQGKGTVGAASVSTSAPTGRVYTAEEQKMIESLRDASIPQIKAHIRKVLSEPLPADYVIPEYIKQAGSPEAANNAVNAHYPQFFGKDGEALLLMAQADPVTHREMIRAARAIRLYYRDAITKQKTS